MPDLLTPIEIERLGAARGLSPQQICDRAGVNYTTFWRWKKAKSEPGISVYQRLAAAVENETESVPQEPT